MGDIKEYLAEIEAKIKYYNNFKQDLTALIKKYGETEYLKAELLKVKGKLEILAELHALLSHDLKKKERGQSNDLQGDNSA